MRKENGKPTKTRSAKPTANKSADPKEKPRMPAKEAMAKRKTVTFGEAYIREVLAGHQRDFEKQVVHATALGLGTPSQLRKMEPAKLREKLAEKIKNTPSEELPLKAKYPGRVDV